jgi:hypothetical protein
MVTRHIEIPRYYLPIPIPLVTDQYIMSVNNDIKGLLDSVNDRSTSAFMWEWFTTKPWLDSGEVRFVCTHSHEEFNVANANVRC